MVDTDATISIAPLELAEELSVALDLDDPIEAHVAGGGTSAVYASSDLVDCSLRDAGGDVRWKAPFFFSPGQRLILLGHDKCLQKFDLTFHGPERELEMTARFKSESIGRPKRR